MLDLPTPPFWLKITRRMKHLPEPRNGLGFYAKTAQMSEQTAKNPRLNMT
jgi:hypothetical protein